MVNLFVNDSDCYYDLAVVMIVDVVNVQDEFVIVPIQVAVEVDHYYYDGVDDYEVVEVAVVAVVVEIP